MQRLRGRRSAGSGCGAGVSGSHGSDWTWALLRSAGLCPPSSRTRCRAGRPQPTVRGSENPRGRDLSR